MSLVANAIAPAFFVGGSAAGIYSQSQSYLESYGPAAFAKGCALLVASVALQLMFVRRCALGGKPSNLSGVLSMVYPLVLAGSVVTSYLLFHDISPQIALTFLPLGGPSRLGASGNQPVYQYRLSDVVDRLRHIVRDRVVRAPGDDFREN